MKIVFDGTDAAKVEFKASEKTAIKTARVVCGLLHARLDDPEAGEAATALGTIADRYLADVE